ncbi:MAG: hypothetical protein HXX13_01675 [Bacteroidetes bacterium]|nr:hypothetical protein [Bacteroidota bacterium]
MAKLSSYTIIRFIALAIGFLPSGFFLTFLIGEGFAELGDGKLAVIPILTMMLLTVSGYILAWKRPRAGGIIMISGGLIMGVYLLISSGFTDSLFSVFYSIPFIIPGILFMMLRRFQNNV